MKVPLFFIFTIFFSGAFAQGSNNADTTKTNKTVKESTKSSLFKKKSKTKTGKVFKDVEVMPQYPGGASSMINYLSRNIKLPKQGCFSGPVYATFVINEQGDVTDARIKRGISCDYDVEVLRVVRSMPQWTPGTQRGVPVKVQFTIPVRISFR